jgi:hypothetical protein
MYYKIWGACWDLTNKIKNLVWRRGEQCSQITDYYLYRSAVLIFVPEWFHRPVACHWSFVPNLFFKSDRCYCIFCLIFSVMFWKLSVSVGSINVQKVDVLDTVCICLNFSSLRFSKYESKLWQWRLKRNVKLLINQVFNI